MKRFLIAGLCALALAGPAAAATYSLTTTTAQEAAITDARTRFNNSQPLGASDPAAKSTNGAFMLMVLTNAITSWNTQPTNLSMDVPTKNNAIALLQADAARGDANSALAQALLTALQNAP